VLLFTADIASCSLFSVCCRLHCHSQRDPPCTTRH